MRFPGCPGSARSTRPRAKAAETELNRALQLQPEIAAARNILRRAPSQAGRRPSGDRDTRAALEQKPDLRLALFNLELAAEQRGDLNAAIAECKQAVRAAPAQIPGTVQPREGVRAHLDCERAACGEREAAEARLRCS